MKSLLSNEWLACRQLVLRHPFWLLLSCGLIMLAAALGLQYLTTTVDYRIYFGEDNADVAAYQAFEDRFEQNEVLIIAVEAQKDTLFTEQNLIALRELTAAGWQLPYALRVNSITNYQHSYARGDDIVIEPLMPRIGALTPMDIGFARNTALSSEELIGSLISSDGKVTAITVTTPLPRVDLETEIPLVANAVKAVVEEFERRHPQLKTYISGIVLLNDAMSETMQWDAKNLYPLLVGSIFFGLLLFFRSLVPALATLVIIVMSVASAYGVAGYLGVVINAASFAGALIILTLGVADCVHLSVTFYQELATGKQKHAALMESMRLNWQPVFLTSLTTAAGFLCLNFSESPPFRDLGNIVAIGIWFAFVFSIILMPVFLWIFPAGENVKTREKPKFVLSFADLVVKNYKALMLLALLVIIGLCAGIPNNRFGDDYSKYFSHDIRFRGDTEFINEKLSGMQSLSYTINAGQLGGVNEPAFLQQLEAFQAWWEQQPETRKVISIVPLLKRLNQTMNNGEQGEYRLPDNRELAAQYQLFYSFSLPAGLSLNSITDPDQQLTRVTVLTDTLEAFQLQALEQRAQQWMANNWPEQYRSEAVGMGILFAKISQRNFAAMVEGIALAILVIAALMSITFKSLRVGLISMIPNILPGLLAFGVWGYSVQVLGISLAVVSSITLGIVVDDSVHFLSKYMRARKESQATPEEAVRYAFRRVAAALFLTSLILVAGFTVLAQSSYQMVSHMAIMTTITIMLALLADFFLLPALLIVLEKWQQRRKTS